MNSPDLQHEWAPWTHLDRPAHTCRLALLTTAGLYLQNWQQPLTDGDPSFRELPVNVLFDEDGGLAGGDPWRPDLNSVFPLERLRELELQDELGPLSTLHYSFSAVAGGDGLVQLATEFAPSVAYRLRRAQVEVALIYAAGEAGHVTAALVARAVELAGVATLVIGTRGDLLAPLRPPRTLLVDGQLAGREAQIRVLREGLSALDAMEHGGAVFNLHLG